MTRRERLADWISGGALTMARLGAQRASAQADYWHKAWSSTIPSRWQADHALRSILAVTEHGKSGTAKRVNRMAKEGLL